MSISFTTDQLAKLKAAYARGVLRVRNSDGTEVTYTSPDQMAKAIAAIEGELVASGAITTPGSPTVRYAVWSRD